MAHTSNYFFFSSRRRHTRLTCDWSSDVCSSDLDQRDVGALGEVQRLLQRAFASCLAGEIGRASCRESVDLGGRRIIKKKKKKNNKLCESTLRNREQQEDRQKSY